MRRALVLTAATALIAGGGLAATATGATTNLRFFAVPTGGGDTPNGFVLLEKLLQNGKKVGTDRVVCTFRGDRADCKITVKLTGRGQIKVTGIFRERSDHGPLKIVGGTGEFAGASGDGNYKEVTENKRKVVLHVTT
jgi:hypothetical protein